MLVKCLRPSNPGGGGDCPTKGDYFKQPLAETQIHIHTLCLREGKVLRLCVANNLTQVIARHCESIAIAVAELGATDLCVSHTLVVQMGNLRGNEEKTQSQGLIDKKIKCSTGGKLMNCNLNPGFIKEISFVFSFKTSYLHTV